MEVPFGAKQSKAQQWGGGGRVGARQNAAMEVPVGAKQSAAMEVPVGAKQNAAMEVPVGAKQNAAMEVPVGAKQNAAMEVPVGAKQNAAMEVPVGAKQSSAMGGSRWCKAKRSNDGSSRIRTFPLPPTTPPGAIAPQDNSPRRQIPPGQLHHDKSRHCKVGAKRNFFGFKYF